MMTPEQLAALHELRDIVNTYLEGSDDASRVADLFAILAQPAAPTALTIPDDHAREMFGCTTAAIDASLANKEARDLAMYAMGTLSNAQELIQLHMYEGHAEWSVRDRDANSIRQLMNIAKYAIDKAVPR